MAKVNQDTMKLHDGTEIPSVGFGTSWFSPSSDIDRGYDAVLAALKAGYRHIDTALQYLNEEIVGRAVRDSGIPREEIFITTKLTSTDHRDPAAALEKSLKNLGTDYVDLYLMHWPLSWKEEEVVDEDWDHVRTWALMQKLPKDKVRSIGVSNYDIQRFEELFNSPTTTVTPSINQVELHPFLAQEKLLNYCKGKNIVLAAYSPLGQGKELLGDEVMTRLASRYGVSPAQLALSWGLKRGCVVLPKSVTEERIIANLKTIDISDEDEKEITSLSSTKPKRYVDHAWATATLFTDDKFRPVSVEA